MQFTVAFIGGGNMAGSLIGGLIAAGHPASAIRVTEPNEERAGWLRQHFGVQTGPAAQIVRGAQAIVLAVKPQQMNEAMASFKPDAGATVISIAAGVRLAAMRKALGEGLHYVRTMPNTPALVQKGITGLYATAETPPAARALADTILQAAGQTVWLDSESQMDAVTALSGSGPAYFFLLTEALREAGEKLGLSRETAAQLAQQTFIGSALMAERNTQDVSQLRANVTSKGGTTEAAVKSLESAGIRAIFEQALAKAAQRGAELGDLLEKNP
jgi:pyrroline-5-carboxylate reductase